jgi:hypothetical protein
MVRERIRKHRDAGVNTIRVQPEGANMDERLETLARVVRIIREEAPE